MAIPDTSLEIKNLDPEEMTLDEMVLLSAPQSLSSAEMLVMFRSFMIEHTNWTAKQIGGGKAKEMQSVMAQIAEAVKRLSVPLEKPPALENGQEAVSTSPTGSSDSPSLPSSPSRRKK